MAKLPRISGKDMLRFLQRAGFAVVRVRGSHHVLTRGETDTVVPVHGNRTLAGENDASDWARPVEPKLETSEQHQRCHRCA